MNLTNCEELLANLLEEEENDDDLSATAANNKLRRKRPFRTVCGTCGRDVTSEGHLPILEPCVKCEYPYGHHRAAHSAASPLTRQSLNQIMFKYIQARICDQAYKRM